MPRSVCSHGSTARGVVHVHWCPTCQVWRFYRHRQFFKARLRNSIPMWTDPELTALGDIDLELAEPELLAAFVRALLLQVQADELDQREQWRAQGNVALLRRVAGPPPPRG